MRNSVTSEYRFRMHWIEPGPDDGCGFFERDGCVGIALEAFQAKGVQRPGLSFDIGLPRGSAAALDVRCGFGMNDANSGRNSSTIS